MTRIGCVADFVEECLGGAWEELGKLKGREMNRLTLDADELMTLALEDSLGVPDFMNIRCWVKESIRENHPAEFRRMFNSFFVVRRNEKWQDVFYRLYDDFEADMRLALTKMWKGLEAVGEKPRIELSFLSKMMSTYRNDRPIWDQNVIKIVRNIGGPDLKVLAVGTKTERIRSAAEQYDRLVDWCQCYIKSAEGQRALQEFDRRCPHQCMCDMKKLDCLLWFAGGHMDCKY